MPHGGHNCRLLRRLFRKRVQIKDPIRKGQLLPYFVLLFGRERQKLITETLESFQKVLGAELTRPPIEQDEISVNSFESCLSFFEDEASYGYTPHHWPLYDTTFSHYISKSRMGQIAEECFEKMKKHFTLTPFGDDDTMEKYLKPGIGWDARDDEKGPNLVDPSYFLNLNGMWKAWIERSDETVLMIDLMEMAWLYKKAAKLIQYTEAVVTDEAITLNPKVMGLSFPTISYWSREGRLMPRRDMRKGKARVTAVPTTFGFRQYVQWGQPYAGFAVVEAQLSPDCANFEMINWIQRYDGPNCSLRTVLHRYTK